MQELGIFIVIQLAMLATALWEARIEGENIGASQQTGWKIKILGMNFTEYHFWLWFVAYPFLLAVPLTFNFSWHLFTIVVCSYFIGLVLEDFMWFVFNPKFPVSRFNSENVKWYPWLKIGKFEIPFFYLFSIILSAMIYLTFLYLS